jgi:hypothetical protein
MCLHDRTITLEGGGYIVPPVSFPTKPSFQPARKRCP